MQCKGAQQAPEFSFPVLVPTQGEWANFSTREPLQTPSTPREKRGDLFSMGCTPFSHRPPRHHVRLYPVPQMVGCLTQNVMTMSDFIESDSALSQMLRSVNPPGVMGTGPSPVVRIVRGAGADGRWTEVRGSRGSRVGSGGGSAG